MGVVAEVERLTAKLGAREASARLHLGLDVTPPPTHDQLAQALARNIELAWRPGRHAQPQIAVLLLGEDVLELILIDFTQKRHSCPPVESRRHHLA